MRILAVIAGMLFSLTCCSSQLSSSKVSLEKIGWGENEEVNDLLHEQSILHPSQQHPALTTVTPQHSPGNAAQVAAPQHPTPQPTYVPVAHSAQPPARAEGDQW